MLQIWPVDANISCTLGRLSNYECHGPIFPIELLHHMPTNLQNDIVDCLGFASLTLHICMYYVGIHMFLCVYVYMYKSIYISIYIHIIHICKKAYLHPLATRCSTPELQILSPSLPEVLFLTLHMHTQFPGTDLVLGFVALLSAESPTACRSKDAKYRMSDATRLTSAEPASRTLQSLCRPLYQFQKPPHAAFRCP